MRRQLISPVLTLAVWLTVMSTQLQAQPPGELDAAQEKAIKDAVLRVAPCVVQIETSGGADVIVTGPRGSQQVRKGSGPTTGVVVGADGFIISSAFNFANKPSSIVIRIPGHKEGYVAEVVATDKTRMLTLLKVKGTLETALVVPVAAPKKDIKIGITA